MLQPIRNEIDLPKEGISYEVLNLEFKETFNPEDRQEMAKDVAAFANAVGGTLLVGAIGQDERLAQYKPLPHLHADRILRSFNEAVRDLCLPKPIIEVLPIQRNGGIVLAVNV